MSNHHRAVLRDILTYVCSASILAASAAAFDIWSTTRASAARLDSLELAQRERTLQIVELEQRMSKTASDIASIRTNIDWLVETARAQSPRVQK